MNANFLIDLATALWLGCTGACVGSFLNVVAYRMPLGMSVVWKPSHCPKCKHPIRAYDNVPVLGWLWLKGKCRDCGEPISPRYAIVEFIVGLVFFVLAYVELFSGGANLPGGPITKFAGANGNVWNPQWLIIGIYTYHCLLICLLMGIALIDFDKAKVPVNLVCFSLLVGVGATLWGTELHHGQESSFVSALYSLLLGGLIGLGYSAMGRGRIELNNKPNKQPGLFKRVGATYAYPENLIAAMAISGAYLGSRALISATFISLFVTFAGRMLISKQRFWHTRISLSSLWLAMAIQIALWKPIQEWTEKVLSVP